MPLIPLMALATILSQVPPATPSASGQSWFLLAEKAQRERLLHPERQGDATLVFAATGADDSLHWPENPEIIFLW
jgi:hypothetical protein